MPVFSRFERAAARALSSMPRLKSWLKTAYQATNYIFYGLGGELFSLSRGVTITQPTGLSSTSPLGPNVSEFFGYFDKSPWSRDGRFYVVNRVTAGSSLADVVVYDLFDKLVLSLESTAAWNWQQGSMSQWLTIGGQQYLAFNTVVANTLGLRLVSLTDQVQHFLEMPLQAANDSRQKYYSINYSRLARFGSDYGYKTTCSNFPASLTEDTDGVWEVSTETGAAHLIIKLAQVKEISRRRDMDEAVHEINHLSVAPDGEHFVFMHRYQAGGGRISRLFCSTHDGQRVWILLDDNMVSHYAWLDSETLIAFARVKGQGDRYLTVSIHSANRNISDNLDLNVRGDGHPTYCAVSRRIVTDTYPDRARRSQLFILDPATWESRLVGKFFSPLRFRGAERIDLHPRWSPCGKFISIDAGFEGIRRNYILGLA